MMQSFASCCAKDKNENVFFFMYLFSTAFDSNNEIKNKKF